MRAGKFPLTGLDDRSLDLRRTMLETLYRAGRGHLPSAYSCIEIIRVLYDSALRISPLNPELPDRDRFILSKGHGCLALYAMLADKGFFPKSDLADFCAFGSHLGGHPEKGHTPGVEASTGSLGHGPSIGVGLALALRLNRSPSRVLVLCGDGESNEGSLWEALLSAAKHRLDNFSLIIDYNRMQSWGPVEEILPLEPYADKFRAFGGEVREVDGHDLDELRRQFEGLPLAPGRPSVIIAHTVKGRGLAELENNLSWHHKIKMSGDEYRRLAAALGGGL